ncbi:hypothetical protein QBC47DRAFT_387141 [Echria macrotheca]|uniref:Uncharacterized protein n=1 Tax=Echria macrotheca TaxID=438768 RepID=A0AAJ0B9M8_9PEZI|nr:hypothetical protein QBC47DRAFT_387141 [Echria macrotheca]
MRAFGLFVLLSAGAAVADHSHLHRRNDELLCNVKRGALKALKALGAEASEFCSSLLDIPATSTSTLVVTPTETVSVVTTTLTITDGNCVPIVTEKRRNVSETPTSSTTPTSSATLPPVLTSFPTSILSSACSRLGLSPQTTVTITNTAGSAVTSTVGLTQTTTVCSQVATAP